MAGERKQNINRAKHRQSVHKSIDTNMTSDSPYTVK